MESRAAVRTRPDELSYKGTMIRMSKLFKKHQDPEGALPKGIKPDEPAQESSGHDGTVSPRFSGHESSIRISDALHREIEKEHVASSSVERLYAEALDRARQLYGREPKARTNLAAELNPLIDKLIDMILAGSDELLLACLEEYRQMEDLLYYHIVNVSIISLAMGASIGYERSRLIELGVASFLHDIGEKNLDKIHKPETLSDQDLDKMRRHPEEGALILSKIDAALSQRILDAVRQEHERADGSGYPKGLVSDEITEYAQIIGLADMYEAMMHRQPYRAALTSLETVRTILKNKKIFSRKVVKALIEVFGLFPVQALVQLNTKEIGVVVKKNQDLISRPIVDILIDSYGKELKTPKRINLAENPVIYIDSCVKQEA